MVETQLNVEISLPGSKTLEEVLQKESSLVSESNVTIASPFATHRLRDYNSLRVVVENLRRGVKYTYAFAKEAPFEETMKAIEECCGFYSEEMPDNLPKFYQLDENKFSDDKLVELYRMIHPSMIIFDERGLREKGELSLEGYKMVEFPTSHRDERPLNRIFLPQYIGEINEFLSLLKKKML